MQGKPKLKQKWDYNLGGLDNAPKPKPTAFYIDSILKDMDSMTYKIKFKNACDGTTHPIIEIPLDNSKGFFAGTLAWQLLKEQLPDAILVEKPDKSKLNESISFDNLWSATHFFEDSMFTHEGLQMTGVPSNEVLSNLFYKKQNEIAMAALKKQNELMVAALEKDLSQPTYSFPTYTHAEPKKKFPKKPELKPGDDWWIVL